MPASARAGDGHKPQSPRRDDMQLQRVSTLRRRRIMLSACLAFLEDAARRDVLSAGHFRQFQLEPGAEFSALSRPALLSPHLPFGASWRWPCWAYAGADDGAPAPPAEIYTWARCSSRREARVSCRRHVYARLRRQRHVQLLIDRSTTPRPVPCRHLPPRATPPVITAGRFITTSDDKRMK